MHRISVSICIFVVLLDVDFVELRFLPSALSKQSVLLNFDMIFRYRICKL